MKAFISHITEEGAVAAVLKDWIESTFGGQCDVFVSSNKGDLPAGTRWLETIEAALTNAQVLLVVCSPASLRRPWINFEAGCGWIKRVPILPICHSGQSKSSLPAPLSIFQAIEIDDDSFSRDLVGALVHHFGLSKEPRIHHAEMMEQLRNAIGSITATGSSAKIKNSDTEAEALERGLAGLTASEYGIFARYIDRDSNVVSFYVSDTRSEESLTAHSLAIRGFLYMVGRSSNLWFEQVAYGISEPVFAYFKARPELLEPGRKFNRTREDRGDGTPKESKD